MVATKHRTPMWLLALLLLSLALSPAAEARTLTAAGGFSVQAPSGWTLKRVKNAYRLSCGNASVSYGRYRTGRTATFVGDGAAKILALRVTKRSASATRFAASLAGTKGGQRTFQRLAIRKSGGTVTVRRWGYTEGGRTCRARGSARAAALIDELTAIVNSARGGVANSLQIKRQQFVANPEFPMQRFEVASTNPLTGTRKFTSALIPETWAPNTSAGEGSFQSSSPAGARDQGSVVLGTPWAVYQPTCIGAVQFGQPQPANQFAAPFTTDPAAIVQNIFPGVLNAFTGGATGISNVRIVQTLSANWLGVAGTQSGLYFVRFSARGRPWNAIISSATLQNVPDACYWVWYSSYIAVADDASPGLGRSLVLTWASWKNSFSSNEEAVNGIVGGLTDAETDFRQRVRQSLVPELSGLG